MQHLGISKAGFLLQLKPDLTQRSSRGRARPLNKGLHFVPLQICRGVRVIFERSKGTADQRNSNWTILSVYLPIGVWSFTFRKLWRSSICASKITRQHRHRYLQWFIGNEKHQLPGERNLSKDYLEDSICRAPFIPKETHMCYSWIQAVGSRLF